MLNQTKETKKKTVCMIVPNPKVRGGIAAVTSGYYGSKLDADYNMIYIQSYTDRSRLQKLIKALGAYFCFIWTLLTRHVDLVHVHSSFGPSFYRKLPFIQLASLFNIPVINHIHGADFKTFYLDASEKKKKRIKGCYEKCDKLIALSDEWKEKLSMITDSDRICVIPNYSTLHEDAIETRLDRRINEDVSINVLFLGELGYRKGVYDIPEVARLIKQKMISDEGKDVKISFVLGGSGSLEDENSIRKLCEEKGVDSMISFPGWVRGENKDEILRNADIFFLPSYNEGMPMSILDACGYGLPVVSTNVGGIPKIVNDGESGLLFEPGNVEGFASAIWQISTDYTLREQYGKNSYQIVLESFSLESHINKLEKLWNDQMSRDICSP